VFCRQKLSCSQHERYCCRRRHQQGAAVPLLQRKEAILFDLLDRYTQRLLAIIGKTEATAQRRNLDDRAALHELIRSFLEEYETSATRHVALLNDTKFLGEEQRELILNRQRDVVSAVTRFLRRAYPQRLNAMNQTAVTMMLFGMINWTFTWLRPNGAMSYAAFAEEVIAMLDHGWRDS
jgi:AcrR family transcriptional regulator